MFKESKSKFDFEKTVKTVKNSFISKGWLVPWETDIQERYIKEGFLAMTKATIIPICRPEGGYDIIQHDKYKLITPLMPLQISIYEKEDGQVYISRMRVKIMSRMMGKITRRNMKQSAVLMENILDSIIE